MSEPQAVVLSDWTPRPRPDGRVLAGERCRLEPLAEGQLEDLFWALSRAADDALWTYLPVERPADRAAFTAYVEWLRARADAVPYAVLVAGRAVGVASFLRIDPPNGSIEVGNICFGPSLRRTAAATEAMWLMMRHAFDDLGYRRYEWKCDSQNAPSVRAAERLGFVAEGVHRQAQVVKGRNRDTAWFSILDAEWPAVSAALRRWLDPANFDADGVQRRPLGRMAGR